MASGGYVTFYISKQPVTGKNYFYFVLHYIYVDQKTSDATLQTIVHFSKNHTESESAEYIRDPLDKKLSGIYGVSFRSFMDRMTFVTDCAANFTWIFHTSVSETVVPLSD